LAKTEKNTNVFYELGIVSGMLFVFVVAALGVLSCGDEDPQGDEDLQWIDCNDAKDGDPCLGAPMPFCGVSECYGCSTKCSADGTWSA
jgi:hypothetical protein